MSVLKTILRSAPVSLAAAGLMLIALPCKGQDLGTVQANGPSENVDLRVQNASVSQVLAELSRKYKVVYKVGSQHSRPLTGHYSGNLRQVLARILDGQNYIIEAGSEQTRVVILGPSEPANRAAAALPAANQAAPPPPSSTPAPPPTTIGGAEVPSLSSFLEGQPDAAPSTR